MLSGSSKKAISGSTIQNSARWRVVLEFSARKVGPKVYALPSEQANTSASNCPLTVRNAGRSKKSWLKSTSQPGLVGAFDRLGDVVQVERGDLEHLAGPFAVAGRDDGRVDVEEALFLEEIVDRAADAVAHPGDGAEGVGPRPQVGDGAQELEGMLLLLQRIGFRIGPAVDGHAPRLDFGGLALAGRRLDQPLDAHAASGREPLDFRFVVRQRRLGQHLDVAETRAVVEFQEAETGLGIAAGADPALHACFPSNGVRPPRLGHREFFHRLQPLRFEVLGRGFLTTCRFKTIACSLWV